LFIVPVVAGISPGRWIIQYDPQLIENTFIALDERGSLWIWWSALVLTPKRAGFLRYLQAAAKVTLNEYNFHHVMSGIATH
jgi:hypothetical protein